MVVSYLPLCKSSRRLFKCVEASPLMFQSASEPTICDHLGADVSAADIVTDEGQTNPAGIADADNVSLGGPASIRSIDRSGFSARRPARTQPAVPPLRFMSEIIYVNWPSKESIPAYDIII